MLRVLLLAASVSLLPQSVWAVVDEQAVNRLFAGSYRGGVKTLIAKPPAHLKQFSDVATLLESLEAPPKNDAGIRQKYPALRKGVKKTWPKQRVPEELLNVQVKSCWIVAVKYEKHDDNDFHVILSNSPTSPFNRVMNVEVSGLPKTGPDRTTLRDVRRRFLSFLTKTPPSSGFATVKPALHVRIEGSLYFDGFHGAGAKNDPGPSWAKPKTVWEIHPIYKIDRLVP